MLKLWNILQQLSIGKDLGMMFLLSGYIVLMNFIFFDYMNKIGPTKKIQFTMEVATDTLEFLDLRLKFDKESKQISVDVFAKDTDSFTYVLPSTCFPKNNIENIPKGVAVRLRRICDSNEKFEKHSAE